MAPSQQENPLQQVDEVVIRFAGDSGDGMQLTGSQFTDTSALLGNDLATFPDYPAEIRAPIGTLFGVSGYQVRFASKDIHTPGDQPDVLVAMNPAALKVNIGDLKEGGLLIVNTGNFGARDLAKAHYEENPLDDPRLDQDYQLVAIDLNTATLKAVESTGLSNKDALRCKNLLALGMLYHAYSRPLEHTEKWLASKFGKKPQILEANILALRAGANIAENSELFKTVYQVDAAPLPKGTYRNIGGNQALAMGLVAGCKLAGLPLFYGSYPITPASDVLHALARYKNYGVTTFQAEDEIAAVCASIGASYTGSVGITGTSGPGLALKAEAMGLAVMVELPLVVVNVQRAGPSTGLPTKTEQADLLQSIFGRNSESPMPVVATASPADCFAAALEAVRIAVTHMTPVVVLSDGYIGNGSEPFLVPNADSLKPFPVKFQQAADDFQPYARNPETLARPWAIPGTPGLEHRVGGLEKADLTGNVSYAPENHEKMVKLREEKVRRIADSYEPLQVFGPEQGDVLVLGWGSTYGAIRGAVNRCHESGQSVAQLHLRNVWPLPKDLGSVVKRYKKVLIPELNRGQLCRLVRSELLIDAISLPKVQGKPFMATELVRHIEQLLAD
ncbi:MAG: 2-oxoacid:acceptor oxidoreductase subunit alpha [Planctomycetota bacterium]|jgi:2-oxoglutarate ferredoxin oxidoreductase subunit alpha|nr:2-oxoacid:acceptor oxidoreductase subunit alpha [Planctomycetota bacterium]